MLCHSDDVQPPLQPEQQQRGRLFLILGAEQHLLAPDLVRAPKWCTAKQTAPRLGDHIGLGRTHIATPAHTRAYSLSPRCGSHRARLHSFLPRWSLSHRGARERGSSLCAAGHSASTCSRRINSTAAAPGQVQMGSEPVGGAARHCDRWMCVALPHAQERSHHRQRTAARGIPQAPIINTIMAVDAGARDVAQETSLQTS